MQTENTYIGFKRNKLLSPFLWGIFILLCSGCFVTQKPINKEELPGSYVLKTDKLYQVFTDMNYHSLVLNNDGTYILKKAEIKFTPVIEQCDIASKGKWSVLSNDVLELTSENNYLKQKGFEYEIKKENKFSQDSLYIQVNFSVDIDELPIKLNFGFNNNNSKSIETEKTSITLSKTTYLRAITNRNHIAFYMTGNKSCKQRTVFPIFEESIDTEKYNYLTITLPNFDRCFFEFEPYNQELIYIKGKNQLLWQGEIWKK